MQSVARTETIHGEPTPIRLGFGELAPVAGQLDIITPAGVGRCQLLIALKSEARSALEDLAQAVDAVGSVHRAALVRCVKECAESEDPAHRLAAEERLAASGFGPAWWKATLDWMGRWNLGDDAHSDFARLAFSFALLSHLGGTTNPDGLIGGIISVEAHARAGERSATLVKGEPLPAFTPPPFNPYRERKADYLARVKAGLDRFEAEALAAGAARTPIKRAGRLHFRLFVRYQCLHESYTDLGREFHLTPQATKAGIADVASLVGVPLRKPDPPGRPARKRPPAHIVRVGGRSPK